MNYKVSLLSFVLFLFVASVCTQVIINSNFDAGDVGFAPSTCTAKDPPDDQLVLQGASGSFVLRQSLTLSSCALKSDGASSGKWSGP